MRLPIEPAAAAAGLSLSEERKIIPETVRMVGPTTLGPLGEALTVATRVCLHPSPVNRIGQHCTTITNQKQDLRREGDYLPVNVKPGVLSLFE